MAKLFASEVAMEIALNAVRIHGGYGYSTEFDVERYFRDAPLMIVGEGTNEIQRNVIAGQLRRPRRRNLGADRTGVPDTARTASRRDRRGPVQRRRAAAHRVRTRGAARLSRQTVRRAFQDLVAEGVVYRVPGRGTYASEPGRRYLRQLGSIEDLMSLSDDTTMEVLTGLRRTGRRRRREPAAAGRRRRLLGGVSAAARRSSLRPDHGSPGAVGGAAGADVVGVCRRRRRYAHRHRAARAAPRRADRRSGAIDYGCAGRRARCRRRGLPAGPSDAAGGSAVLGCPRTGPSSCRSVTSCPSSTPTG